MVVSAVSVRLFVSTGVADVAAASVAATDAAAEVLACLCVGEGEDCSKQKQSMHVKCD